MRLVRLILVLVVAFLVFVIGAVLSGTKVTVTCGPAVSTPPVVVGLNVVEKLGRSLHDLYTDGPTPLEVVVLVQRVMNLTGLLGDTFGAALRGERPPKDAEGLRRQAGEAQAAAVLSCSCVTDESDDGGGGRSGGGDEGWDPKDASFAAAPSGLSEAVARSAARRYFPASQVDVAVAVAGAESSWRPTASLTYRGNHMRGLWQINDGAHPDLVRGRDWRDPNVNAWMAYQVWLFAGRSWHPWSTYNSGSYKRFLHSPIAAMPGPQVDPEPIQPDVCPAAAVRPSAASSGPGRPLASLMNRRTPTEAVAFMARMYRDQADDQSGRCLHWVALAYGYPTTSDYYAIDQWRNAPNRYRHPGDRNPPAGALLFWETGRRAGHVALSAGGGMVYSTDTSARHRVGLKPFAYFRGYGRYLGYTDPYFRNQTRAGVQA